MENLNLVSLKDQALLAITQYGGKILLAVVVFIIGRFIIGKITNTNKISCSINIISVGISIVCIGTWGQVKGIIDQKRMKRWVD